MHWTVLLKVETGHAKSIVLTDSGRHAWWPSLRPY